MGPFVVAVTGASAGVGRAVAVEFARRGATVALLARGRTGLDGAAADVRAAGGRPLVVPCDVADADAVERAADDIEQQAGPIDVWVNDAMTTVFAPADRIDPAELRRVTDVTYLGSAYGTLAALRRMKSRDAGVIVNVSSALAFRSIPLQSAYCGAKAALRAFTDSVRTELLHDGSAVRVTMVHLPAVNTPQFDWCRTEMSNQPQPVAPIYEPERAARAVVRAAASRRRDRTMGAVNKAVIVGTHLAPGLFDHFAARTSWDGQLGPEPLPESRPDNLFAPVDGPGGADVGIRGRFGSRSGGVVDRSYLVQLPATARDLVLATWDRVRDRVGPSRRSR